MEVRTAVGRVLLVVGVFAACSLPAGSGLVFKKTRSSVAITERIGAAPEVPDLNATSVGAELWKLGRREHWRELDALLAPLSSRNFSVLNAEAEGRLDAVRRRLDGSRDETGRGIVHELVGKSGGRNFHLLRRLLAVGVDPDPETTGKWRPSHLCGMWARPKSAFSLGMCRANLSAENGNGHTPVQAAASKYKAEWIKDRGYDESELADFRPDVVRVWEQFKKDGFPTVAQMARKKHWWAVRNLCRRRLVAEVEMTEKDQDKTAVEWAEFHGEHGLASELEYYFTNEEETSRLNAQIRELQKEMRLLMKNGVAYAGALKKIHRQQRQLHRRLRKLQEVLSKVPSIEEEDAKSEKADSRE